MAASFPATRPLSGMEELWVRASELGTGCCVVGFEFGLHMSVEQVRTAVKASAARHSILVAKIRPSAGKGSKYEYIMSSPEDEVTVERLSWPLDDNTNEEGLSRLQRLVELEFGLPFSGEQLDVCQIHVYTPPVAGSTFLAIRLHGSTMDRPSAVFIAQTILANLNAAVRGKVGVPGALRSPDFPTLALDLVPKSIKIKGFLTRTFDSMGYIGSALKLALAPFQPGCSDYHKNQFATQFVEFRLDATESKQLLDTCSREEATLFGAEVAALFKAVSKLKKLGDKKEEYGVTSLFDCRAYLEPPLAEDAVGLYYLGIPMSHKVNETTTQFWEVARALSKTAADNLAKGKIFSEMQVLDGLFSYALKNPGLTPEASLRTALCSANTGAPQAATWHNVEHLHLKESLGPFVSMHGIGPCFAILDKMENRDLSVALVYASPLFARSTVVQLAEDMRGTLLTAT